MITLPDVVIHGSKKKFSRFDDSKTKSIGHHFGDTCQASSRIKGDGYIYEVRLTCSHPLVVEKDLGWESPKFTLDGLFSTNAFPLEELKRVNDALCNTHPEFLTSPLDLSFATVRAGNAMLIKFFEAKGYDSIFYPNTNEPKDGERRQAFCVFHEKQANILSCRKITKRAEEGS